MAIKRDDFPLPDVDDALTAPYFVGAARGQAALVRPEGQVAGAPRYIDIAGSADDGVGLDGNFPVMRIGEIEMAVEQAVHHPPVTAA